MWDEADFIPLSALQHWVFCQRQCGLIHLERIWDENRFTAEGRLLHEKAHGPEMETRGQVRMARGLSLSSSRLGLVGVADVVEFHREGGLWRAFPVEYKRGRPKSNDADRVQLCAQAFCLEEMLGQAIENGALFYGQSRRREPVSFDDRLRAVTLEAIGLVREMFRSGVTPPARQGRGCESCSMASHCLPGISSSAAGSTAWLRRRIKQSLEET